MKYFQFYSQKFYIKLVHFFISSIELEEKMETLIVNLIPLEGKVNLTPKEKEVFAKILPFKQYLTGEISAYKPLYSSECNTCRQCPGCGSMCNND